MTVARTYQLMIPAPDKWLSANDRRHRYGQAAVVRTWRQAAFTYARKAQLPRGLARVRIDAVLHFPTRRGRDEANYQSTLKPIVDGLGPDRTRITTAGKKIFAPGWGLITDDTPEHLDGPHLAISPHPVAAPGYVVVTITDLSEVTTP